MLQKKFFQVGQGKRCRVEGKIVYLDAFLGTLIIPTGSLHGERALESSRSEKRCRLGDLLKQQVKVQGSRGSSDVETLESIAVRVDLGIGGANITFETPTYAGL